MNVEVRTSDLANFVEEQVRTGRFASPDAVVEGALRRMMEEDAVELTDEDIEAIKISDEQFARGEGISADEVERRLRQMYRKAQS